MVLSARTITKNFLSLTLSEAIAKGLAFFLWVIITRSFGPHIFGKYSYAVALTTIFVLIVDFGLTVITTREVTRQKDLTKKYIENILLLKVILSTVMFGLLFLFTEFITAKDPLTKQLVYVMGFYAIINNFVDFFKSIFRAYEKMELEGLARLLQGILITGIGLFIIWRGGTIITIAWLYALVTIGVLLLEMFLTSRFFAKFKFAWDFGFWKNLLSQAWPLALSSVFVSIYYYLDTVMLSYMKTDAEVAWYNAAYRPLLFLIFIAAALVNTLFPLLARLFIESKERLKEVLSNLIRFSINLALPIAFGGTVLAPKIIPWLYGDQYLGGVLALQILIWSIAAIYINIIYSNVLLAAGNQIKYLWGVMGGAFINIVLNLIIIPRFSLYGAAATTVTAEVFVLFYMYYQSTKIVRVKFANYLFKPLIASILMTMVLFWLIHWPIIILLILGVLLYVVFIYLIRGWKPEDIKFFKEIIKKAS